MAGAKELSLAETWRRRKCLDGVVPSTVIFEEGG